MARSCHSLTARQRFLAAVAPDALADLFRQIQNDGRFDERDSGYVKIGCALKAALPQHIEMARELYIEFDGRYHRGGDSTEAERTFNSLDPPFHVGVADILEWARGAGIDVEPYLAAVREIKAAQAQSEFADMVEPMPPDLRKRHVRSDLIIDNGDLPETAERLRDALVDAGNLFERDRPVVVLTNADGSPEVHHLGADRVVLEAHKVCRPTVIGKTGPKSTTLPDRVAKLYLAMRGDWRLPSLHGVAYGPLLSGDGSIRHSSGYDQGSKLWCAAGVPVSVPDRPNEGDALIALRCIRNAFRTFAVADAERVHDATVGVDVTDMRVDPGQDETALLCGLLTAAVRPSIDLAPGFLVRAPETSGSSVGKGLLVRAVSAIAFGRSPQAFTPGNDVAELKKRVVAALLEAEPVVFLDNVNGKQLRSGALTSVLTENPAKVRVLGKSETALLNSTAFIAVTGNGLSVSEDLARRFIHCALDARTPDPENRPFAPGFVQSLLPRREDLLSALLTIWRWGRQSHLPKGGPLGSYEAWAEWVRDPLLALGCRDPVDRVQEAKSNDPVRARISEAFACWHVHHGVAPVKAADLHEDVVAQFSWDGANRQALVGRLAALVGTHAGSWVLGKAKGEGRWAVASYFLARSS